MPAGGTARLTTEPAAILVSYTLPNSTPPVITPNVAGTLGSNGWYVSDVTLSWTVSDPGSTVTGQTGCGAQSVTSDTPGNPPGVTFTCSATSGGGSNSQSVTIQRDATAPTLAPSVSPNPVPLNGTATASANANDATSGVASQGCDDVVTTSAGAQTVSCTATDKAGNTATAAANYTVINSAPVVVVTGGACLSDSSAKGGLTLALADADSGPNALTLTLLGNSNPTLVPNANVQLGGSGANRTLTVTAAAKKSGTALLTLRVSDGANTTDLPLNVQVGTDKNETLNGTANTDLIFGLLGANTINGLGGSDLLCGGNGVDTLNGGDGDDSLGGNRGSDVLNGEAGDDRLTGGQGAARFSGGDGTDGAADFTPSQGDTEDGTVEGVTVQAAGANTADTGTPEITDQIFLPAVQH